MTATPIPRTLALTLYGDLDVSVLDELPPGRMPVVTRSVADERAPEVWDFVRKQIGAGHQAYVVYPVIEENEERELKAALVIDPSFWLSCKGNDQSYGDSAGLHPISETR